MSIWGSRAWRVDDNAIFLLTLAQVELWRGDCPGRQCIGRVERLRARDGNTATGELRQLALRPLDNFSELHGHLLSETARSPLLHLDPTRLDRVGLRKPESQDFPAQLSVDLRRVDALRHREYARIVASAVFR